MHFIQQLISKVKNFLAASISSSGSPWLWRWYHRRHKPSFPSHHDLLHRYQLQQSQPFFVQVGANSAKIREPLHRYVLLHNWPGIMVEPQPEVFGQLTCSFSSNPNLRFEQLALAKEAGTRPFFSIVSATGLPAWVKQLSSLDRNIPATVLDSYPEAKLLQSEVQCITLQDLLTQHQCQAIDLLIIDAEGYDYDILQGLNWTSYRPALVFFEHYHLSPADYAAAKQLLRSYGYSLYEEGMNLAAIANINHFEAYKTLTLSSET